ncbi:hypothetical protein F4803DRAFT_535968 [Xylaria telfairii]|nr:hypothetical protein F4803DRAFT_535968 [Xylaria telfairii]
MLVAVRCLALWYPNRLFFIFAYFRYHAVFGNSQELCTTKHSNYCNDRKHPTYFLAFRTHLKLPLVSLQSSVCGLNATSDWLLLKFTYS